MMEIMGGREKLMIRNGSVCPIPPAVVISPVIAPRNQGEPRPVSEPSSDCDSENPIEIPAPTDAASPTRHAFHLFWKPKAAANTPARVELDPSIRPRTPGSTTC